MSSNLPLAEIICNFSKMTEKECLFAIASEIVNITTRIDSHSKERHEERAVYQRDKVEIAKSFESLRREQQIHSDRLTQIESDQKAVSGVIAKAGGLAGAVSAIVTLGMKLWGKP